ncbi:MAG: adenylyltransferase/cytidyltransferase family protein [Nanoarchaeota archaeon]|nr:adenylyltransferase/cytidyltransferase family protein [Nanoarchaeota archaeon]
MKTRVVCAGTFDILHTGHIEYLKNSKALSKNSELIVIVARDINSERIKGKKPINNENIRLKNIQSLNFVDNVILGSDVKFNPINTIASLNPDIIALGHDQWAKEEWLSSSLKEIGITPKIVRMPQFEKRPL